MIHPSAIIDPDAQLAEDVKVGPYTVISAGVSIDSGCEIGSHVVIKGQTRIGRDNKIFQFSSIGEDPQDMKYAGEVTHLEIGDRNTIREFVTLNRGTVQDEGVTRIGNDVLLMAYVHIAHDCKLGNNIIMANNASLAGHVEIQDWVILGGHSLVHQFTRIGTHAFSGYRSGISKDVPPFVMVDGQPAAPHGINSEGLRRRGFSKDDINEIKMAYRTLFRSKLPLEKAIDELDAMASDSALLKTFVDFLRSRKRSIVR